VVLKLRDMDLEELKERQKEEKEVPEYGT